jgi:hypothetical protein
VRWKTIGLGQKNDFTSTLYLIFFLFSIILTIGIKGFYKLGWRMTHFAPDRPMYRGPIYKASDHLRLLQRRLFCSITIVEIAEAINDRCLASCFRY